MKQVRLSAVVNPNGYATTVQFYVGIAGDFQAVGEPIELEPSQESSTVSVDIDLEAETDYEAYGTAENEAGNAQGNPVPFRTPDESGAPTITDVTVEFI